MLKALRKDIYRLKQSWIPKRQVDREKKIKEKREEAHISNEGDRDNSMKAAKLRTQCFTYLRRNK